MFRVLLSATFVTLAALLATAEAQEGKKKIVEITGETATISLNEIAHIRPGGIAGSKVKTTVKGPAKHAIKQIPVKENGKIVIGPDSNVIEIIPTGKGTIDVLAIVTSPIPDSEPKTHKYKIEVK